MLAPSPQVSWIVGIDPGVNGALAFLGSDGSIELFDIPTAKISGPKAEIDEHSICRLVDSKSRWITCAWIEHTWARPGEGVVNAAAQVGNYKFLRGVFRANFV